MKRTLTLAATLAAVILLINVFDKVAKKQGNPPLFKNLKKDQVTQITLSKGADKELLKKSSGKWVATTGGEYPADTSKINELLDLLSKQKQGKPSSKNPAKFATFKVDTAGGTKVEVVSGGKPYVFIVGGPSQGWTGSYLRFDGKNEVYVSQGSFDRVIQTSANYYREKTLVHLNKDNVNHLSVMYKENPPPPPPENDKDKKAKKKKPTPPPPPPIIKEIAAKFDIAKGTWQLEKPETADGDPAQMNEYLAKFTGLEVDGWYDSDPAAEVGFENPWLTATLQTGDGATVVLVAGNEKDGKRYVKIEGDPNKYQVQSWRLDQLKKNWEELKKKEGAAADSGAAPVKGLPGAPK